ncbi:hypothetical protein VTP01DRAFT_8612 [Rhizomucor pusillus]|uniref:uncharacterized protein n=1 Tax=Rhizomucor pusillus TaxID=4840 RepID=UPI003743268C
MSTTDPVQDFIHWLQSNGCHFDKFAFKKDGENIGGVYAKEDVSNGETLATLPFRMAITSLQARNEFPTLSQFSSRVVLTLYLLQQKILGEKSFYWPYIRMLPESIITPMSFEQEDMKLLENTNLAASVPERKQSLFNDFQSLIKVLPASVDEAKLTWDEFLWAYSVLSSRSFPYSLLDPSFTENDDFEVLFPLLDALNHRPNTKITWERRGDPINGTLAFITGQEYKAGEQLYNNYGPKSNEELLLGYGFCFEYNEFDYVALKPNFSQDPNQAIKKQIISQAGITSEHDDPLLHYIHRNNIPSSFYRLMRVLMMNPLEVKYYANCSDSTLYEFIGYRNELAMLNMTIALLQNRLLAIQKLSVDRTHLKPWQRFIFMYRDGQIDVLKSAISCVEKKKQAILHIMAKDVEAKDIAPETPLLSVVNPEYYNSKTFVEGDPFLSLNSVVITPKGLLQKDPVFKEAIESIFEDLEEEQDVIFMLSLINEKSKKENSRWHYFIERTSNVIADTDDDTKMEVKDLYDSLFPAFSEALPDVFRPEVYNFEALLWAESLVSNYSLDNPLCIVPV